MDRSAAQRVTRLLGLPVVARRLVSGDVFPVAVLGMLGMGLVAGWASRGVRRPTFGAGGLSLQLALISAAAVALAVARRPGAWDGARVLAGGLVVSSVAQAIGVGARHGPAVVADTAFAGTVVLLQFAHLAAFVVDFRAHVRERRGELLSDIALVATVAGGAVCLLFPVDGADGPAWHLALTATTGAGAVMLLACRSIFTLWCPSRAHAGLLASSGVLGAAGLWLAQHRDLGLGEGWPGGVEMLAALSVLATAAVLIFEPRWNVSAATPRAPLAVSWIRIALLGLCLVAALGMVALFPIQGIVPLGRLQSGVLILLITASVALRMLASQADLARGARVLGRALEDRDAAIGSLREAAGSVAASEKRLQQILDSAVDGIVELDSDGTIVRANEAFCAMVRLPMEDVSGRPWAEMAARSAAGGETLAALPDAGEAILRVDGAPIYIEARSSALPTDPPGTLLLIRDVTASRVAERTIRTLFQFLQDRDEDRTRLLQRTNAAIEAERNRIARDLHDGPIQGISGASLSLQAVKLMIEGGQEGRAGEVLGHISSDLAEQATDLRRLMSDLRPPVLEERGLFPAVRELAGRMQRETGIEVTLHEVHGPDAPADVQTLAYRIVQEALSNVAKHARARSVEVRVEGTPGSLQVEVIDDGRGFDAAMAREFLYRGKVGLASMRERTELVGGSFLIRSGPDHGTTVTATLPFDVLAATPRLEPSPPA